MEIKGKKSYVDIVKGGSQHLWKGPVIKAHQQTVSWMVNSAIGQFNTELDFDQLGEEFVKEGMDMVKLRYMGDSLAMLTPREVENMDELINLNKEWFESVFDNIEPWSENRVAGHKIVWVRCYGLPYSLWNMDCLFKVV